MSRSGVVLAAFLLGCGTRPAETDAGAGGGGATSIRIVTETLASGRVGVSYSQPLSASEGTAPYGWVIVAKSPSFTWLSINGTTGTLSGLPNAAANGSVTVSATDQNASTAIKEFSLNIDSCQSGSTVACASAAAGVRSIGTQSCVDGQLSGSCVGTPSTDLKKCGPSCGACDAVTADRCTAGACACGTGPACAGGSTCCAGVCKNLDDAKSCGSCGNDCTAQAAVNVAASCASRQCAFACSAANLNHCVGNTSVPPTAGVACETDLNTSPISCGSCGHGCAPLTNANTVTSYPCVTGQCQVVCASQRLNCNGASEDGCEVAFSTSNCGFCGNECQPGANVSVSCSSGTCGFACNAPMLHCVGGSSGPLGNNVSCETNPNTDRNNCGGCGKRCEADQVCSNGTCTCSQALCGSGQTCLPATNRCGCDASTCPAGCCSAQGAGGSCSAGTANDSCGQGGATCAVCGATCPTCTVIHRPSGDICSCGPPNNHASMCDAQACVCNNGC
jgi:Putative Ig domain